MKIMMINDLEWKKATIRQFNEWTEKKTQFLFEKRLETVLPFIPTNSKILDVGCGDAEMLEHIQRVKTPTYAVGVDFREKLINLDAINILRGDAENLPFKDQSFECVIIAAAIEHLPSPINALTESKRILKQGGTLIITTPNPIYARFTDIGSYFKFTQKTQRKFETEIDLSWLEEILKDMKFDITYSRGFLISPINAPFVDHIEEIIKKTVLHKILLNQIIVGKKNSE